MGDVAQLAAAGRGGPEGAQAALGPEIPGIAEPERPLCLDCRRELLAGGTRAERNRRVARREGAGASVRLEGPEAGPCEGARQAPHSESHRGQTASYGSAMPQFRR